MMAEMKCPNCGSNDIRVMFSLMLDAPVKYLHNITKTALRDKDVELWGAFWENRTLICRGCQDVISDGLYYNGESVYKSALQRFYSCPHCEGHGFKDKEECSSFEQKLLNAIESMNKSEKNQVQLEKEHEYDLKNNIAYFRAKQEAYIDILKLLTEINNGQES